MYELMLATILYNHLETAPSTNILTKYLKALDNPVGSSWARTVHEHFTFWTEISVTL